MPVTTWSSFLARSSTTSWSPPAPVRRRSRPTATRSTAGRRPAHRPAARPTRTTGSPARPRTRHRPPVRSSTASFARQGEILGFLVRHFGRYPFSASGGIVDDVDGLGFALENQTRPIYARDFFTDPAQRRQRGRARARPPVVRRQRRGRPGGSTSGSTRGSPRMPSGCGASARDSAPRRRTSTSSTTCSRRTTRSGLTIGDPGPDNLFDFAGLRPRRDDAAPAAPGRRRRRLLPHPADLGEDQRATATSPPTSSSRWPRRSRDSSWTSLFQTWLFTTTKPVLDGAAAARLAATTQPPAAALNLLERNKSGLRR